MAQTKTPAQTKESGWVVAAIVAVVAVCAVSFMISQRPRQAMAVAAGDTLGGEMRGPQAITASPDAVVAPAPVERQAAAAPAHVRSSVPHQSPYPSAFDANAAAANASATEQAP